MSRIVFKNGLIATLLMTFVLYAPAILLGQPALDFASILGGMFSLVWSGATEPWPGSVAWWLGMSLHFLNGAVVFPSLFYRMFHLAEPQNFPGESVMKGVAGGLILWIAAMTLFLPLAGQGFFGAKSEQTLGISVGTLFAHLLYGGALGALAKTGSTPTSSDQGQHPGHHYPVY